MASAAAEKRQEVVWRPQSGPQHAFVTCPFFDVLFGGARGGGKSDACLGEFAIHAKRYGKDARGVFMRREMPQADSLIDRSHDIYGPLGWSFTKIDRQWVSPEGAILRFRPLEDDRDAGKYQGQNFTRVFLEELTHWSEPKAPDKMKATLRSAAGVPCRYRATANPGGAGHHWVKDRYIDPEPMGRVPILDEAGHFERMFIPARVSDNLILLQSDPGYVDRLKLTGSAQLVKAWLEGDWSVIEGAFFDNWSTARHVTAPFEVPEHWLRFRSGDWGSAKPFSFHWYAVASEDMKIPNGMTLPRGGLVLYRQWYGASSPNVGLKLTAEVVGLGLAQRSAGETYGYSVLDPAAFAQDGGPSIAERIMRGGGGAFRPADNTRIGKLGHIVGWDLVRHRFDGEGPDRPMLVAFDTARDFIRTVPLLQHDADRAEDVDTDGEDHCFVGSTLVDTGNGSVPIADLVGTDGLVNSIGGLKKYRLCRVTQRDMPVVRLRFDNGRSVTCTPNHQFLLISGQWERADRLLGQSVSRLSPRPFKSSAALDTTFAALTFSAKAFGFIGRFGRPITGRYQPATTCTTSPMTAREIRSRIWNYRLNLNIKASMALQGLMNRASALINSGTLPRIGTKQVLAENGIGGTTIGSVTSFTLARNGAATSAQSRSVASRNRSSALTHARAHGEDPLAWTTCRAFVNFAARNLEALASGFRASAASRAARVISIESAGSADVYCLEVPDTHAFTIEGGIVVHNCGDTLRYAAASRPWIKPAPQGDKPVTTLKDVTIDRLWKARSGNRMRV